MPGTTPINALPYPVATTDAPNGPQQIQNLAVAADTRLVARFATTAARDSAITSPLNGMTVWCDAPGAYFDRVAGAWVARPQLTVNPLTISGASIPASAKVVHLRKSATTTVGASGGFNASFGFTFTGLMAVGLAAGDNASSLAFVVPIAANHTVSQANGIAFTSTGAVVANGATIRVEIDVIGYV